MISVGDQLPDTELQLRRYLGDGPLLILFYTEAHTPLCTQQLCAFRDDYEMVRELRADAIAISSDTAEEHERFSAEHRFPFPLLSDPRLEAAGTFGVSDAAAKRARRAAFVADPDGTIRLAIPFYQPNNLDHYQLVFEALGLDIA